jgi:hypothetical protein
MLRIALLACIAAAVASCDLQKFTVNQTAPVLKSANASLQQESDFETAYRAIPGALKTVEGFWVVNPDNKELTEILTEGYCQYGTAIVEDDWEVAKFAKKLDEVDYDDARATKAFTRCLNYALLQLGDRWQKDLYGTSDAVLAMIKDTGHDKRTPMMWAALAIGSIINHNLRRPEALAFIPLVKAMLLRVVELDKADPPSNEQLAALPHVALGMIYSAASKQFGGDPDAATAEFQLALTLTHDKLLLARTLYAYRVGLQTNNRKLFHDQLVQVLSTDPAVWPEQRLANEVAHRKARRYLSHEKDLF